MTMFIGEYLNLNMVGLCDKFFDIDVVVSEGVQGLTLGGAKRTREGFGGLD